MFELRELDDDNNNVAVIHEVDHHHSFQLKIIFEHIIHWISLWNSSMGRDFIYNIESLENGISVIDHILTPKDEEPTVVVDGDNNLEFNENREDMEQEILGGSMQRGIVDVQPERFRNCK